jgi:hypothetical protein
MDELIFGFPKVVLEELDKLYQEEPDRFKAPEGNATQNILAVRRIFDQNRYRASALVFADYETLYDTVRNVVVERLDDGEPEERILAEVHKCLNAQSLLGFRIVQLGGPMWLPSGQFRLL